MKKIVIGLLDEHYDKIVDSATHKAIYFDLYQIMQIAIVGGTVLPDNPTNGDMIKAVFKEVQHYSDGKICADWWNAPYKKEVE